MSEIEQAVDKMLEQDFDQVDYGDPDDSAVARAIEYGIPAHIAPGLIRYIHEHVQPGGFLLAVFENDLFKTFAKADMSSRGALERITSYIYNHAPAGCWGSKEAVKQWLA